MDIVAETVAESGYGTPIFNSTLLSMLLISLASDKNAPITKKSFRQNYDYIIVGGGSAGAALASRLSEVPCVSVLLLEAGKVPPRLTDVPAFSWAFRGSDVDWKYQTLPQKYAAQGYKNKRIKYPRGKMLGGSSSLNGNQYVRGNRKDYDLWAAGGAEGWSFEEVLPYFKKMEDNKVPELFANEEYHGVGGPLTVTEPVYVSDVTPPLFEAYRQLGLEITDINGPTQTGSYILQETIRNGQRCSTAKAYLVPKENANNLDIVTNAFVTKIAIKNKRATGVLFDFEGQNYYVKANKEIVLSSGVINTPQLLMLSGIGPANQLKKLKIPVATDLPVGLNLNDHCAIIIHFELDSNLETIGEKLTKEKYLREYIDFRSGPLTINHGNTMGSFTNEAFSKPTVDFPSMQIYFFEASTLSMKRNLRDEIYEKVYAPYENKTIGGCVPVILRPKTRGSIELQSIDPYDAPIIDLQYLKEPSDLDLIVEGMKLCQSIIESEAMKSIGSKSFTTLFPGCEILAPNKDSYFRCVAKLMASTGHHQVGTAKMGDPEDPTTVVDPQLRVKNIENLRVVDASVMPEVVSGNTNVPTIMIAEKAADMIKETIVC